MIKPFALDNIREVRVDFDPATRRYFYTNPEEQGLPALERCVEVPWIHDKLAQVFQSTSSRLWERLKKQKVFDFGCNKARYLLDARTDYGVETFGIDMKAAGKDFVDAFFHAEFDRAVADRIRRHAPFDVCTAISAVEHAGYARHPDKTWITEYQMEIVRFLIDVGRYCFISVPFGQRPGWAQDGSRKNFYQFDPAMLAATESFARYRDRNYLREIYKYDPAGIWIKSDIAGTEHCLYRDNKGGALAVALISVWR